MKHLAPSLLLFFCSGLFSLSAWACSCATVAPQELYDHANTIVLVNVSGNEEGKGLEVLRSWKTRVTGRIDVPGKSDGFSCAYGVGAEGIYLLYLRGSQQSGFSTRLCSGNLHESAKGFRERIDWLEEFAVTPGKTFPTSPTDR